MDTIALQLVTPEKTVLSKELASLSCPTTMGEITVLPHHEPLVAELATGEMHARTSEGEDFFMFVSGGFIQVQNGSKVLVLADAAEHHYEIDQKQAEEAVARAQEDLKQSKSGTIDHRNHAATLEKNLVKVKIAKKRGHSKGPLSSSHSFRQ